MVQKHFYEHGNFVVISMEGIPILVSNRLNAIRLGSE